MLPCCGVKECLGAVAATELCAAKSDFLLSKGSFMFAAKVIFLPQIAW
jgi:hypothetical protein